MRGIRCAAHTQCARQWLPTHVAPQRTAHASMRAAASPEADALSIRPKDLVYDRRMPRRKKPQRRARKREVANELQRKQAGYSSVGRASDCRITQESDGPWFDSGWPDFCSVFANARARAFACSRLCVCVCVCVCAIACVRAPYHCLRVRAPQNVTSPNQHKMLAQHSARRCMDVAQSSNSEASTARLAQSVERKALNLVVVGSSPTVGAFSEQSFHLFLALLDLDSSFCGAQRCFSACGSTPKKSAAPNGGRKRSGVFTAVWPHTRTNTRTAPTPTRC